MKLYDATLPIHEKMVIFPGDPPFQATAVFRKQTGDDFNLTRITMGTHLGTHYEIFCLPLKIKGADGAPARVLLRG